MSDISDLHAPQYSIDAEKAVLSSMLARTDIVLDEIGDCIVADDFFVTAHKEIFSSMIAMHSKGQSIDITTLHHYLESRKIADEVGSPGILAELAAGLATHLNVQSYVAIVKDKSRLRGLLNACIETVHEIEDSQDVPSKEIASRAESRFFKLNSETIQSASLVQMCDAIPAAIDRIKLFASQDRPLNGIPCGIPRLDRLTTGWHGGEMIVIAARPGVGKTAMALQFAKYAAEWRWHDEHKKYVFPGHNAAFFSIEMTQDQLMPRVIAAHCASSVPNLSMQALRSGKLNEFEIQKMELASEDLKAYPIFFDFADHLTMPMLSSRLRRLKRNYEIDIAFLDYLQLLNFDDKNRPENRQQEVTEISRGIKRLAKELDIPIVILAQLNRKSEEANKKPSTHNLRESGAIEQEADVIILLHKDQDGAYGMQLAKQRNGPTDEFPLVFHSAIQKFEAFEEHQSKPAQPKTSWNAPE